MFRSLGTRAPIRLASVACPVCSASHVPVKGSLNNGVYASTCEQCGHFFKFKAIQDVSTTATFKVNGKEYTVGNEFPPSTTLSTFLRSKGVSKGTKAMCYEGGCGVCLVTVTLYAPILQQKMQYTVNSCLLELFSCDGMEITTIEGLGDARSGYNIIQEQLAEHDGAQCGYCSPAQVMNMYGLLKAYPKPTVQQIEDYFDATVCRCTGYRAILDAMKTFAVDAPPHLKKVVVDIEDLDTKLCKKTGNACTGHCHGNKSQSRCENQVPRSLHVVGGTAQWLKPTSMDELCQMIGKYAQQNYRLVYGNTAAGVYPQYSTANYDILIDTRQVMELYGIDFDPTIVMGANLSISTLQELFDRTKTDPSIQPYGAAFADHLKYIASTGVRNMACWAGNVMLKHMEPSFTSDIFLLLESIGGHLIIYDKDGNNTEVTMTDFLKMDMAGKLIGAFAIPTYSCSDIYIRTYKRGLRLQQCVAYVNAAFNFQLDSKSNYLVKGKPTILFGGISSSKIHASDTEAYLEGKALGDADVLKGAFQVLEKELVPDAALSSGAYRKSLALSLFYKYILDVCQAKASTTYVSGGTGLTRTPIVGTQDYGTRPDEYPLTEPMPKVTAKYLTSGQIQFTPDLDGPPGTLFAVPVLSTIACGTLDKIDASEAKAVSGVVAFLQASDIPSTGVNNWRPQGIYGGGVEELLCSKTVGYAGQPIGLIVADSRETATQAAGKVKVTYKDVQTPIVTIEDAINKKSFHPNPSPAWSIGDAKTAISKAPHKINGNIEAGDQYHFHMETQAALCSPTDDGGMEVHATSQWLDGVLETVAQVTGLKQSQITVETKRLGGGFGGKISQNFLVSGLCALASNALGVPVKMHLDIHTNMKMCGKRSAYRLAYNVGFDDKGKLLGIDANVFADVGINTLEGDGSDIYPWLDNAYYCPNWLVTPTALKTNKAVGTACRAPGSTPAIFFMESMMEQVADYLQQDQLTVRQANLYVNGETTITQKKLEYCTLQDVVAQHAKDVNYTGRQQEIAKFNQENRWKKKGLALMPNMFGISWEGAFYTTQVIVFHGDASVAIAHGGIDMGQGINTKVMQVCAYELNIPMDKISVKRSSTTNNANSMTSGGSITSEMACKGVIECCAILQARMAPVKAEMKDPTWEKLVAQCYAEEIDMTASYMTNPPDTNYHYMCFSAATVEAEVDILTGQYQFTQMDMLYDCGESMNPELDIGQAEGGFLMGMGYFLTESLIYDTQTGEILNANTWNYKPPLAKDLPMNYNFKFQRNAPNPVGVLRSKAVAEPALVMSAAALLAIKHAIQSARQDAGHSEFFSLDSPATPEKVQQLCYNSTDQYTFGKTRSSRSRTWMRKSYTSR